MAKPQHYHLWALAHAERAPLAEDLCGLSDARWRHRSLCGKWDVEEVVAHLSATAGVGVWKWLRRRPRARFPTAVHNQGRLAGPRGSAPAETLDRFRAIVESTTA